MQEPALRGRDRHTEVDEVEPETPTARGLLELDREACLRLLADDVLRVGRVAVVDPWGRPEIFPVNYALARGEVLFRTGVGTKLDAATRRASVAFEVDALDPLWREGWSVLVKGTARRVGDAERDGLLRDVALRPWAPGDRDRLVAISPDVVTGRRIV